VCDLPFSSILRSYSQFSFFFLKDKKKGSNSLWVGIHKDKKMCHNTVICIRVVYYFHQFLNYIRVFSFFLKKIKSIGRIGLWVGIHKDKKVCCNAVICMCVLYHFYQSLDDIRAFLKDKKIEKCVQ
jgi:hypothetical protein